MMHPKVAPALPRQFLIRMPGALPIRWNGRDPIRLTSNLHLENTTWLAEARRFAEASPPAGKSLLLSGTKLTIEALKWPSAVHGQLVPGTLSFLIPKKEPSPEQELKRPLIISTLLFLLLGSSLVFVEGILKPKSSEELLIPRKYVRILLTTPSSGSQTAGGVRGKPQGSRAFRTRGVQAGVKALLKNSLSSSMLLSTGKTIQHLSQSLTRMEQHDTFSAVSSRIAGAAKTGSTRLGSGAGYDSEIRPSIEGQGKGKGLPGGWSVGLDTLESSVDEGLTREEVARVIHSHMNEIRYCYEAGILRVPTLAGKLLVDFKINPTGQVPSAGISEASLADAGVRRCLLMKLRGWQFPKPRGGVQVAVSYPFIFKSLTR